MSELESCGEFRFSHEVRAHPLAEVMREINRLQVVIAQQVAPPDDGDVEAHLAYWSVVLGISRTEVNKYMEIGYMLGRMPQLAEMCQERGHLSMRHLAMLGKHTRPVVDEKVDAVESGLVAVVKPRRDGEALRGVRAMATRVQRVIGECAPEVRPRDVDVAGLHTDRVLARNVEATVDAAIDVAAYQVEEGGESAEDPAESPEVQEVQAAALDYFGDRMTAKEFIAVDEHGDAGVATLTTVLERHHAVEALAIIDAVAKKMKVSRAAAFMHALRGTCEVEVNLELFRVLSPGVDGEPENTPVWLAGAGWLSTLVAESWLKRVSTLRVLGDSAVEGYRPSESQRAFVRARDGVCVVFLDAMYLRKSAISTILWNLITVFPVVSGKRKGLRTQIISIVSVDGTTTSKLLVCGELFEVMMGLKPGRSSLVMRGRLRSRTKSILGMVGTPLPRRLKRRPLRWLSTMRNVANCMTVSAA